LPASRIDSASDCNQRKDGIVTQPTRLRFGAFFGPYHPTDENPTVAFERDLQLIQWLDQLDFDEAWVGEHHSGGWETISAPEIMLAVAAERTRHIKLGTGVVSVPFHHPLHIANRLVLLDHLTRGRIQMATGPGLLMSDHHMLGLDGTRGRESWEVGMEAIVRLLTETEPFSMENEFFTLNDAQLQLRPYQHPRFPVVVAAGASPAGATLAGRYADGILTFGASLVNAPSSSKDYRRRTLNDIWKIAEESAEANNRTISREGWRFAAPIHLAETREQAFAEVRAGAGRWVKEYLGDTLGQPAPDLPQEEILDFMVENGRWIVGTPDDCVRLIESLTETSGGFGALLAINLDWAPLESVKRSYEMLARYVMPRFRGSLTGVQSSQRNVSARKEEYLATFNAAIQRAEDRLGNKAPAS